MERDNKDPYKFVNDGYWETPPKREDQKTWSDPSELIPNMFSKFIYILKNMFHNRRYR